MSSFSALGRSTLGMRALSHYFFFQTVNWTAPYFDAYVLGERGPECSRIGQNKTKEFSPEKRLRCYRFFEETPWHAQGPCTIAAAGRSAPLIPHLLFSTAPPARGRVLKKIAR